jgi:nucleoside-diphosphate-sugar epimerase
MTETFCECGCGTETKLWRGTPRRFIHGHSGPQGNKHGGWVRDLHPEPRGYATPCLISGCKPRSDGYVRVQTTEGARYLHRVVWEAEKGPIPEDREIDHLCYERDCANTDHMELVTRRENNRRRRDHRTRNGPILVTGSEGFIASHLIPELENSGHEVVGIDCGDGNLTDASEVYRIIGEVEPSTVVHLAAFVGRQFCEDDPMKAIRANVGMTASIARACSWIESRLVYTSTSEVYGDYGDEMCHEFTPQTGKTTGVYALSKRMAEEMCRLYAPDHTKILRPSMPYGPGLQAGRGKAAIVTMLHQALHRQPIIVHRGAMRSWCWIGDAVCAMRMVIESSDGGPFNIGRDDADVSMLTVAQIACELTDAPLSLIQEIDPPELQTVVKRLSTDRIRSLGWYPTVDLEEGMGYTLEWVKGLQDDGSVKEEKDASTV